MPRLRWPIDLALPVGAFFHRARWLSVLPLVLAGPAIAAPVIFDFDSPTLALSTNSNNSNLGYVASSSVISTYMTNVLRVATGNNSVGVTVTGAVADHAYTGEGHVVGSTLGTSDYVNGVKVNSVHGTSDNFLMNDTFGVFGTRTDSFTLTFSNYKVSSITFDYEIFPNGSCPYSTQAGSCYQTGQSSSSWPDISVWINNNSQQVFSLKAPKVAGQDPQYLGTVTLFFAPTNSITFRDWPATIGVDDLALNVPEPGSLALLGLALAGMGVVRRRP